MNTKYKKIILSFFILIAVFAAFSTTSAEDIDVVVQKFKAAQEKLRTLRQSGATPAEIAAQNAKVTELRTKISDMQASMGQ